MRIKLAKPEDFEVYKSLYDAWECDMLYRAEDSDIKPHLQEDEPPCYFDEETLKMIEEENRRTLPKFLKYISEEWYPDKRIYMFLDGDVVFGFAEMFRCARARWKIEEVCLLKDYQTPEIFAEVIETLLKMPFVKELDVCVIYDSCKKRVMEAKFKEIGGSFFRRKRNEGS